MNFKVAILQQRAENAHINNNIEQIIMAMKEASNNMADILLLPECFITGYDLPITYEKSISDNDECIQKICRMAEECWDENGICIDNTIVLADALTMGIFYAEFDMDAISNYRSKEMMRNTFRKVNSYTELLNKTIEEPFIRQGQNRYTD